MKFGKIEFRKTERMGQIKEIEEQLLWFQLFD
jgi:hypothetical protein